MRAAFAIGLVAGAETPIAAQPQPTAPAAQGEAAGGATKRLGRQYPAAPPQSQAPPSRADPQVHVSIVSPKQSGVFQRGGHQNAPRNAGSGVPTDTGLLGGGRPGTAPPVQ